MSASLIGGLGAGPVASGSGTGVTMTLTLTADITADCVLHLVWLAGEFGQVDLGWAPNVSSATDTFGHTWTVFSGTKALIGQSAEAIGSGVTSKEIEIGSALASCSAGDLSSSDTITLNFDGGALSHPTLVEWIGMAFAVTGVLDTAESGWKYPPSGTDHPGTEYGQGLTYPNLTGGGNTALLYSDSGFQISPDNDCAIISAVGGNPSTLGTFTPVDSTVIGTQTSTNMKLAAFLIPSVTGGDSVEPGASWQNAANLAAVNYQGMELAAVPTGPRISLRFRAS